MSAFRPWRVAHVALDGPPTALNPTPGEAGIVVAFWRDDIALGQCRIANDELPLSAPQLAERAAAVIAPAVGWRALGRGFEAPLPLRRPEPAPAPDLEALRRFHHIPAPAPREPGSGPAVSVIVCTRYRPEPLLRCLTALQACVPGAHELLVVDNGPDQPATREIVARFPGVRWIPEPRPGLSIARNTGLRSSTGTVIAFTDDDVVVHPSWVARLQDAFDDPTVDAVTGLVLPASLATESEWAFEVTLGGFGQGFRSLRFGPDFFAAMRPWGVPVWRIGAGANMALRREMVEALGGFDERLGAGASGCSEDSELWYRMLADNRTCLYDPTVVVHHHHRGSMEDLTRQMEAYARGHVAALCVQLERHGDLGNLYRICLSMPAYYLRLLARDALTGFRVRTPTLGAQVRGFLQGVVWYLEHRHLNGAPAIPPRSDGR